MSLICTLATNGGPDIRRWTAWLKEVARHPGRLASVYVGINHWSERSIITLVM